MSTKETIEFLKENLERWQKIEKASITQAEQYMDKTENVLIETVLQILQRDSSFHHRLQELLIHSIEKEAFTLTPADVSLISDLIDRHDKLEKDVLGIATNVRNYLGDRNGYVLQKFILDYLIVDEKKHDTLLESLAKVKSSMYPYSG
jgi:hypothetical protein